MLPITFLSDYGNQDEFVGICHGVIQRIAPGATVVDLVHGLPPRDVRAGALALRNALDYVPKGVHLAVVDPGVGTARRPLALRCGDGQLLVGPDNGLLWPAADRCGGVDVAIDLAHSPYRLEPVSATFHGRDLFAPVAARLALGTPIEHAGSQVAPDDVTPLDLPRPKVLAGEVAARVLAVDRFGNLQLNLHRDQLEQADLLPGRDLRVQAGPRTLRAVHGRTFADAEPGGTVVFEDSSRAIAIAVNGGSAAEALQAGADAEVKLRPWSP